MTYATYRPSGATAARATRPFDVTRRMDTSSARELPRVDQWASAAPPAITIATRTAAAAMSERRPRIGSLLTGAGAGTASAYSQPRSAPPASALDPHRSAGFFSRHD